METVTQFHIFVAQPHSTSLVENLPKTYLNQISVNCTYFKTVHVRSSFIRYREEIYLQAIEIDKTSKITGQN